MRFGERFTRAIEQTLSRADRPRQALRVELSGEMDHVRRPADIRTDGTHSEGGIEKVHHEQEGLMMIRRGAGEERRCGCLGKKFMNAPLGAVGSVPGRLDAHRRALLRS